jgi:glutamate--cysteine ligase
MFPEVRLKTFLEMRGADGGPGATIAALPAFWVGLLYDPVALDGAWELVKDWSEEERQALRLAVPKEALKARFRKGTVLDIARAALALSREGLRRRARHDTDGADETKHLAPIEEIAESGVTAAERALAAYAGEWRGNIDEVFRRYAY